MNGHRIRRATILGTLMMLTALAFPSVNSGVANEREVEALTSTGCGVERWSVKTGTDADAGRVNMNAVRSTVAELRGLAQPTYLPDGGRIAPTELQVYQLEATLTTFVREADSDYHLVVADGSGATMIVEIAKPDCVFTSSPFASGIANSRAQFEARYSPTASFQYVSTTVCVRGVGFFDHLHGQRGVAPNGIELHPLLDVQFNACSSTPPPPPPPPPPPNPNSVGRPWTGGSVATGAGSAATTAYFAEGFTGPGFQEYLTIQNPGAAQNIDILYLFADGSTQLHTLALPGTSRTTVDVNSDVGAGRDVSVRLTAGSPFVAERPMYFNYKGWTGGHDAMGVQQPATSFYFAEGFTGAGFDEFLTILNPGDSGATVDLTYILKGFPSIPMRHVVGPHTRATINVRNEAGSDRDVSIRLQSDLPIVAERPMYFSYGAKGWTGGSVASGATAPSTSLNLAEGFVGPNFDEYVTLMNPNPTDSLVTITYLLTSGRQVNRNVTVPAFSRWTEPVAGDLDQNTSSSIRVSASLPVVVERSMYFDYQGDTGGHDAVAVPDSAVTTTALFAEGFTGPGFSEYLTVLNPGAATATATIVYYFKNGGTKSATHTFDPHSRTTIFVNDPQEAGPGQDVSAAVTSNLPLLVERPMYFAF